MVNVMITGSKYTEDSGHCWFLYSANCREYYIPY